MQIHDELEYYRKRCSILEGENEKLRQEKEGKDNKAGMYGWRSGFFIFPTFQLDNLPPLYISGDAIDIAVCSCLPIANHMVLSHLWMDGRKKEYANTIYDVCLYVCLFAETIGVTLTGRTDKKYNQQKVSGFDFTFKTATFGTPTPTANFEPKNPNFWHPNPNPNFWERNRNHPSIQILEIMQQRSFRRFSTS